MRPLIIWFILASIACAEEKSTITPEQKRLLSPHSQQVKMDNQTITLQLIDSPPSTLAELWPVGSFVGVLTVTQDWLDFRGQQIKLGTYTLRYLAQPKTADHEDTAPSPHFLVLSPVNIDRQTKSLRPKELILQSRQVSGGNHPAVLAIIPVTKEAKPLPTSWRLIERAWKLQNETITIRFIADGVWNGK